MELKNGGGHLCRPFYLSQNARFGAVQGLLKGDTGININNSVCYKEQLPLGKSVARYTLINSTFTWPSLIFIPLGVINRVSKNILSYYRFFGLHIGGWVLLIE